VEIFNLRERERERERERKGLEIVPAQTVNQRWARECASSGRLN
jgi:hypothetical protein